ncbi:bifunctional aspartate kinase/homoserine dehydrogenase II [Psychrobium sp. 1_MG-2023]|uniref:bifunctional aspartate kinase/homoserine dehydrogenase II n=1 Tax=Psychrobium sp. 1_MG-2023 TaxID=3062624 RepID=UPI000C31EE49|nr:bifunctional aspartate kinase/homoserine dehydrogenase II [Psychrobium sp. 1_MG-2023]MDP2562551.1 bifunctional aspartate kinase/homoserine dehydrogenase II [Psychrobium sp. 1_MG-2023]PKF54429.1 bifunctional aspartate kinase/homoserine dehydrogenase II [Alteromonadales bacterium alter-6D02]
MSVANIQGSKQKAALHKFGGSSLANPACYTRVANLLLSHSDSHDLVVVSAAGKTTNKLLRLTELAQQGYDYLPLVGQLKHFQQQLVNELLSEPQSLLELLDDDFAALALWLAQTEIDLFTANKIVACGEVWSSRLLAALLSQLGREAVAFDTRDFLVAQGVVTPIVDEQQSAQNLENLSQGYLAFQRVFTGFICRDEVHNTLLLGRNGSDYSATLIAKLAGAGEVNIWTDVAGVYSADPNLIKEAALIEELSLAEAEELARLGNPVLHRRTLQPLAQDKIALRVRSSFEPDAAFTEIGKRLGHVGDCIVNGMDNVELYHLPDNDKSAALLESLPQHGFFPLVATRHSNKLLLVMANEVAQSFEGLLNEHRSINWTRQSDVGLISLLDAGVSWYRKLFNKLLAKESLLPVVLSDNGLSLSAIVPAKRVNILAYLLHQKIYTPAKRVGVVLLGAGNIGRCWLDVFNQEQQKLEQQLNVHLPVVGIVRSSSALIDFSGIKLDEWQARYQQQSQVFDTQNLLSLFENNPLDEIVMLDITADQGVTNLYPQILSSSYHLVSANKLAGSGANEFYQAIKQASHSHNSKWLYNASVGAGLPIQYAINDLRRSGDAIQAISGVFSGTLSWLFQHYDDSEPFSQLLLRALSLGITEPDPRDDLSGKDKQRKLLILARESGYELDLHDIELNSMVPDVLSDIDLEQFLARAGELDELMSGMYQQAKAKNCVIRYVAELIVEGDKVNAKVGLQQLANDHPFAALTPSDNVFLVKSQWYQDNPLIIRGPGAGREVTAAAVQSDLVQVIKDVA